MKVQEREERRGEQGKGRTEEKDKLLETAEKKEEEDSGAYERASEILKDQKLSPLSLLRGLVVQPACLPACLTCRLLYRARGGQWIALNDTKARELRLGMKPLASHNRLLLRIKSCKKREKQLWSALSLSLPPSYSLFSVSRTLFCPHASFMLSLSRTPVSRSISRLSSPLYETWYCHIRSHCSNDVSHCQRMNLTQHTHTSVTL